MRAPQRHFNRVRRQVNFTNAVCNRSVGNRPKDLNRLILHLLPNFTQWIFRSLPQQPSLLPERDSRFSLAISCRSPTHLRVTNNHHWPLTCRLESPLFFKKTAKMPPAASKGKSKGGRESRRSRSRNTTPSSVGASASSFHGAGSTAFIDSPLMHLMVPTNLNYDDILERHGSASGIPDTKHLETLAADLRALADLAELRGQVCDRGMRELSHRRKERLEEEMEKERENRDAEERRERMRRETLAHEAEEDRIKNGRSKKRKDRSGARESRPLAHGAHSVARQDGLDVEMEGTYHSRFRFLETTPRPARLSSSTIHFFTPFVFLCCFCVVRLVMFSSAITKSPRPSTSTTAHFFSCPLPLLRLHLIRLHLIRLLLIRLLLTLRTSCTNNAEKQRTAEESWARRCMDSCVDARPARSPERVAHRLDSKTPC